MSNELGKYEIELPLHEINESNTLEALLMQFRNEARAINNITNETSPVQILNRFNLLRHTMSNLQDDLIKRSLDSLKVEAI